MPGAVRITFVAFFLSFLAAQSFEAASKDPPTADALIAAHLKARGGSAALKALASLRFRGTLKTGSEEVPIEILKKRENLFLMTLGGKDDARGGGFRGSAFTFARGRKERAQGATAETMERASEFDDSYVDYATKGHEVELLGRTTLDGKESLALRVRLKDGLEKRYYFDPKTFLVTADWKGWNPDEPASGQLTLRQDYRAVAGVLFPFLLVEEDPSSGTALQTLRWDTIEPNVPLDSDAFLGP